MPDAFEGFLQGEITFDQWALFQFLATMVDRGYWITPERFSEISGRTVKQLGDDIETLDDAGFLTSRQRIVVVTKK